MASALSDIKRRIGSTAQIRKVTSTLQRVAAAKLAQDQRRLANANHYFLLLCHLLEMARRALPANAQPHPLMKAAPAGSPAALLVFGSDRGLCGSFNTLLMKSVADFLKDRAGQTVQVLFRGRVTYNRAMRLQMSPIEFAGETEDLGERVTSAFTAGQFGEVHVMHWDFISPLRQEIVVRQVLPATADAPAKGTTIPDRYRIEPSPQALVDSLLPEYIRRSIYNAVHKSAASENAQRQASMSRASENAGEMLRQLRKQYSRLRQESITTEMLEIIAGMNR
jgi:F-type H+-transporting ATPase subunit gamma